MQWLPGGQWLLSRALVLDSPSTAHSGDLVLVNATTGELVPLKLTGVVELYIIH
jgi:hypothetical protein